MIAEQEQPAAGPPQGGLAPLGGSDPRSGGARGQYQARLAAVQNALASQRMEGLEPEAQVLEDAQKWARGEKTISQAIADFKARLQRAPA